MSAINVIVQETAVHLLTDGAAYQMDGTISAIGPKVALMPHLNCAVAFRGPAPARAILAELISVEAHTFDELRDSIGSLMQKAAGVFAPIFQQCGAGPDFEVVVAGWSGDGPAAYMVASHGRHGDPWEIIPLTGLCITPANAVIHERMLAALPNGLTDDDVDPVVHGLAIMGIQRAYLIENHGIDGRFCAAAGFAQLTTVTAEAVTSRVIHRWPDKIGEPTMPAAPIGLDA
jgi:hypothetical protein